MISGKFIYKKKIMRFNEQDVIIGLTASGTTLYVVHGLEMAQQCSIITAASHATLMFR